MSGPSINLLPSAWAARHGVTRRVRLWRSLLPVVAAPMLAGLAWCRVGVLGAAAPASIEVARLERRAADADAEGRARATEVLTLESARRASAAVSDLPDWALLLAMLPGVGDGRATLTSFTLTPQGREPGTRPPPGRVDRYVLAIQGVTPDAPSATDMAIAMERLGVFASVRLVETQRVQTLTGEGVSFRIECVAIDGGEGAR